MYIKLEMLKSITFMIGRARRLRFSVDALRYRVFYIIKVYCLRGAFQFQKRGKLGDAPKWKWPPRPQTKLGLFDEKIWLKQDVCLKKIICFDNAVVVVIVDTVVNIIVDVESKSIHCWLYKAVLLIALTKLRMGLQR